MVKIISTINLKGGVGKTSLTVALCEFFAIQKNKKVLIIDLDPQTNASVVLIGEDNWLVHDEKKETIAQLFQDKLNNTKHFNINNSIIKKVSNIRGGINNLDLLPSSLQLIEIQDFISIINQLEGQAPYSVLREVIEPIKNRYDYIFIDCPPNLGYITLNGIYISDFYLIPTIPDILSTYGIPQILNRIENFKKKELNVKIKSLGIIINMYRKRLRIHDEVLAELYSNFLRGLYPRVFENVIPLTVKMTMAVDFIEKPHTLRQKYGPELYEAYSKLSMEIITCLNEEK